jgi:hypothetical protein
VNLKFNFPDYEVAIVYHDDNASRIPHAHVVVNNTNLATRRRLQDPDPRALKHNLQTLAKGRGLSDLDIRERERFGDHVPPRTMQRVSCTTDGYGRVTLDGRHRYLASPDLANAALTVATSHFHAGRSKSLPEALSRNISSSSTPNSSSASICRSRFYSHILTRAYP